MMIDSREVRVVASAMIKYGGSFVHCLGEALDRADPQNIVKIKETWPEYWKRYLTIPIPREEYKRLITVEPVTVVERDRLRAIGMELLDTLERLLPHLVTEIQMLDYASLNEGCASEFGVASIIARRVVDEARAELKEGVPDANL